MKRPLIVSALFISCLLCSAVVGCGTPGPVTIDTSTMEPVRLADVTRDTLESTGDSERGGLIFVPAGSALPLQVNMDLGALRGEFGDSTLRFTRDVYMLVRNGLWLSPDRQRWARVDNLSALRDVFGLGRGQFQIGLGVSKERGTHASIELAIQPAQ